MGRVSLQNLMFIIRESFFLSCIIGINVIFFYLGLYFLDVLFLILIDILLLSHYIFGYHLSREVRKNVDIIGFLFFPVFFTLICILFYYYFIEIGLIGGTLIIPIIIIFSSFVIIYSLFQLFKVKKLYGIIKNIQEHSFLTTSIRRQIIVLCLSILVFFVFSISPGFIILIDTASSDNECEVKCIVLDLINKCNNDTQKVKSLLSWFDKNLSEPNFADMNYRAVHEKAYFRFSVLSYIYEKTPHLCFRWDANPHWIINSRCGRCGEHADLFLDMATKAGLSARKMKCDGENHAWNEVYISELGEWIPVDASAVNNVNGNDGFVKYDFMEAKVGEDLRRYVNPNATYGNVSYVSGKYFEDGEWKTIDRTKNYTDTTNITLNITDSNGNHVEGVNVKVYSYNRPKWFEHDGIGITNITNTTGQCTFEIGGGEYHFKLQKDDLSTLKTDIYSLNETSKQHFLDFKYNSQIEDNKLYEKIIPFVIIGIIIALLILYIKIKKPPRKTKR